MEIVEIGISSELIFLSVDGGDDCMKGRNVFSISKFIYYMMVLCLSMGIIFFTYRLIKGKPVDVVGPIDYVRVLQRSIWDNNDGESLEEDLDMDDIEREVKEQSFKDILTNIGIRGIEDPRELFIYQMPFMKVLDRGVSRGKTEDRGLLDNIDGSQEVVAEPGDEIDGIEPILDKELKIPDDIKIVIEKLEDDLGPIELTGEGPQILIYHSHSREAYMQDPDRKYKESTKEAFRSDDLNNTVVRVGDVLAHHLKEQGIPALHDRTEHEQGNYNRSYVNSLETLNQRMKEYDSLKIFIDIHRNAYKKGVKSPDDEIVVVEGKRVAKISVVIGTGKGSVGGFKEKPNWKENYKFALKLTNKVNEICPGLAKPVMVQNGRYNQHISTNAILIEVGSNLTTLTEAERTTEYIAQALGEIVK